MQNHPSPSSPGEQQRPGGTHTRAKSNFSLNSHKSSGSASKVDRIETHGEKESLRLHGKTDPTLAMTEAEPSAVASEAAISLSPIRGLQHKDSLGNPIADPDRSNPTRSRWERPLDTIRAFEAAIDGNYYSRKSFARTESDAGSTYGSAYNRRSSNYGSNYGGGTPTNERNERPRYSQGWNGRQDSYRSSGTQGIDNFGGPGNRYQPNRAQYPRTLPEQQPSNGIYPNAGVQHSYETVTTASGSGSLAAMGYLTNSSSENSSVDRIHDAPPQKEPAESLGFNGFGNPQYNNPSDPSNPNGQQRLQNQGQSRVPIKLESKVISVVNDSPELPASPAQQKRKSWFSLKRSKK